jgi:phospholipase/lecithinase/hemolysin
LTTTSTPTTLSTSTSTTSSGSGPTSSSAPAAVKYLITFGDSYSQTGFDINSTKPAPGNPLGNPPLPGWTASGGLNWVGFLTSVFNTTTVLTYNFAYGGATTNATLVAPYEPTVLSLIDQVAEFSGSIASKPSYAPWTAQNSLFGVWIGVNDVGNSWWLSNYTQIVDQIMDSYFGRLQVLYDAGARNFVLLSVPRKSLHKLDSFVQVKGQTDTVSHSHQPDTPDACGVNRLPAGRGNRHCGIQRCPHHQAGCLYEQEQRCHRQDRRHERALQHGA